MEAIEKPDRGNLCPECNQPYYVPITKTMHLDERTYFTILRHCWGHTSGCGINGEWGVHTSDVQFFGVRRWAEEHRPGTLYYLRNN